jgi:short-chain Z-isoprenyl diphosphate synthase
VRVRLPHPLYGLYERRLAASLPLDRMPRHVGVILDGNRRWARSSGVSSAKGHRAGARKIEQVLDWSEDIGVEVVTLWMLSTDNLSRDPDELDQLLTIIEDAVCDLAATKRWRLQAVGSADLLPDRTVRVLRAAEQATAEVDGMHVNVAVGYGGHQEITDAVRAALHQQLAQGATLEQVAASFDVDSIAEHLYTRGQPDPDLVIRTSGEQRLSGFLLWQSAYTELYFCEVYWPDFRRVDFLRAMRSYAQRDRRRGR